MFTAVVVLFGNGQRNVCWGGINTERKSSQYQYP